MSIYDRYLSVVYIVSLSLSLFTVLVNKRVHKGEWQFGRVELNPSKKIVLNLCILVYFVVILHLCDYHNIIHCSMFMLRGRTYSAGKIGCDAWLAGAR